MVGASGGYPGQGFYLPWLRPGNYARGEKSLPLATQLINIYFVQSLSAFLITRNKPIESKIWIEMLRLCPRSV